MHYFRKYSILKGIYYVTVFFFASGFSYIAFAVPPASPYSPGATLDPTCAPGGANCTVSILPVGSDGYVQFNTGGAFTSDAGMFWDNTNKRFGLGATTPAARLDITNTATSSAVIILRDVIGNVSMEFRAGTSTLNNTFIGVNSGSVNSTGSSNTGIGHQALLTNITGGSNTAVGFSALTSNVSGNNNVALGREALSSNLMGTGNIALGYHSLRNSTTSSYNIGIGSWSLYSNTTGNYNVANGAETLYLNTTGSQNAATGYGALYVNTTGSNNIAYGSSALQSNTTASNNVALGYRALFSNTTVGDLTAVGHRALYSNTSGTFNTAVGIDSLYSNTSGTQNSALGRNALVGNVGGSYNTATGYNALTSNTNGSTNSAFGVQALSSNLTGSSNTAVGYQSLYSATTTNSNTGVGYQSLYLNTAGYSNTAIGDSSLLSNTTGYRNIANGAEALYLNTTGSSNTANGYQALFLSTTGTSSVAVGERAGYSNTTGSQNTFLGMNAGYGDGTATTTANLVNATAIGYNAQVTASSSLVLGGTGAFGVNVGVGVTAPAQRLHVSQTATGVVARFTNGTGFCDINPTTTALVCTSDATLKKGIERIGNGLESVLSLRGVMFKWLSEDDTTPSHVGFVAQEVEKILPQLVATDPTTGKKSVNYIGFTPILVEAIKELANRVAALEARIAQSVSSGVSAGLANVKDFVVETLTAKKVVTENIEMKDSVTGEIYCLKIANGEWDKSKGACSEAVAETQLANIIVAVDGGETATTTEQTVENNSSATTTDVVVE